MNISPKTLRSWINTGEWDKDKTSYSVTRPQLLEDAYSQLQAINEAIKANNNVPTKSHYDAKNIIRKEIESLSDNKPRHIYEEVFSDFLSYIKNTCPEEAVKITRQILDFLHREVN